MAGISGIQEAMNLTEQQKAGGFVRDPKEPLSLHTLVKPLSDMTPDEQKAKLDEVMEQYKPKDVKELYESGKFVEAQKIILNNLQDEKKELESEKTEEKKVDSKTEKDEPGNREKIEVEKE